MLKLVRQASNEASLLSIALSTTCSILTLDEPQNQIATLTAAAVASMERG
jgi:hypothetical protein